MRRSLTRAVSFLLIVAACTTSMESAKSTNVSATTTVPKPTLPATTTTQASVGPGRLVVVDQGGDVVVIDPDGSNRRAITDDAGDTAIYSQPIWSPDGSSLAWGQATADGFAVRIQGVEDGEATLVKTTNQPFYMYWSPDSQYIGALHSGADGLDFVMVDVAAASASVVDTGSPFYFSWSPDSERVVTHVGPDRFENVDTDGAKESLGSTAAGYLAPQWTPAGIFHVVDGDLVVEENSGERRQIAEIGEFTFFVANHQGTRVALQSTGANPGISVGLSDAVAVPTDVVVVVDVATGETEAITESPAFGFFWSPDGESLLMMIPSGEAVELTVWDGSGEATGYGEFRPSIAVIREMVPFFPQYAQSIRYWSPDSKAFTYAGDDGVWVQRIGEEAPTKISDGSWVAWSSS